MMHQLNEITKNVKMQNNFMHTEENNSQKFRQNFLLARDQRTETHFALSKKKKKKA